MLEEGKEIKKRTIENLLQMDKEVRKTQNIIEENSTLIQKLSKELCEQHSKELDGFIKKVQGLLEVIRSGEKENYSSDYIELQVLSLPTFLYDAVDGMEDLGCKQDLSKIHKDEVYSEVYSGITQGTIPDKEAEAKQKTIAETITMEIYKRAYNKLKKKYECGQDLLASLKKVLDHRIKNLEVFRQDTTPANMKREIDEHEQSRSDDRVPG